MLAEYASKLPADSLLRNEHLLHSLEMGLAASRSSSR